MVDYPRARGARQHPLVERVFPNAMPSTAATPMDSRMSDAASCQVPFFECMPQALTWPTVNEDTTNDKHARFGEDSRAGRGNLHRRYRTIPSRFHIAGYG